MLSNFPVLHDALTFSDCSSPFVSQNLPTCTPPVTMWLMSFRYMRQLISMFETILGLVMFQ